MKKTVCILTAAAAMIMTHSIFAQAFTDVAPDSVLYKSVEDLAELDILSGYNDGTIQPENSITRAEFAELAAKALPQAGNVDTGAEAGSIFVDVDSDFWASHSIELMAQMGYIDGYDDKTFRPDNDITGNEAVEIIMEMLGYGEYVRERSECPQGYIEQAKELGITDGLSFDGNSPVKRGDIILMIDRMLDTPLLTAVEYNVNTGWKFKKSDVTFRTMSESAES